MSSGELIDFGIRVYRRHALPILGVTVGPMFLIYAGLIFWSAFVSPSIWTTRSIDDMGAQVGEVAIAIVSGVFICIPLIALGIAQAGGILVMLAAAYMRGDEASFADSVRDGRKSAGEVAKLVFLAILRGGLIPIAGIILLAISKMARDSVTAGPLSLLFSVLAVCALLLCFFIVPWVMHSLSLAPAIVVVEGLPAKQAFHRGNALLKGAGRTPNGFWTNLSIFLLVLLAWFIYTVGIGSVFDLLSINGRIIESGWFGSYQDLVLGAVNMMPQFLATWLLMPVAAAAYTGHYFDRRVRLEAYDVKVLTEDIQVANRRSASRV